MASSPETGPPPENTTMSSPPPSTSPPPLQQNPSLTTAAPSEPPPPDHATLTPPPPPGQATAKSPEPEEPSPPPTDGAGPPPSLSPRELAASASPALGAAPSEEPTSTSPPPPVEAVEVSPEATAGPASPPPSPQIAEASPGDAPPPSPPPTPPASISGTCLDASSTDAVAMASEEAAGPFPAPESMDADPHTAPATPTPPLEGGPEGLLPQQQPRPHSSLETAPPGCENSESTQLTPPPAETTYALPDAAETDAVAVTSVEAAGSPPALEATDGETDTTPSVLPALKSEAEGSWQEPVPRPPSSTLEAEPCSPEMAPPGFENFKSSWLSLPPRTPPAESTHFLLDATATKAVTVMPEEAAGTLRALKAMNTDTAPGLPPSSSESGAEGPLQQPRLRPPSPITQAEPCSPDMPPPGFENFKSSWLPLPILPPLAETTYALPDVAATKAVAVTFDEAAWPVPALEEMDVETDTACSLLPPMESGVEVLLQQPLLRPPSSVAQSAPCSPEMAPPGFENFKSSWPPLPPQSQTAYVLPDAVATKALSVTLGEAARSPPALDAMDTDMDATNPPPLPLESGVEGLLQEPLPRPSYPTTPCSSDMAPPGFENFKSSQPLLPSLPPAQIAHTLQDPATTEAVSVKEEAHGPPPSLEAMDANMDAVPALLPSSESGAEGSLPRQLPRLSSPMEKGTACSLDMMPSGCENLESSHLLPQPALLPPVQTPDAFTNVATTATVTVELEEAPHPPPVSPVSGAMEEGTMPILPPPLESGSEGSLQQLESQAHSPTEQAADTLPDAPATKSAAVTSGETVQPPPALQATNTSMDNATALLQLSESGAEGSLLQPSSPTMQAAHYSLDSLQLLPPPPTPCQDKEMAQLVCGSCRDLLAYPRGATHVQCAGCQTINLVLEAHEVGKVYCGRCETLLMYPSGAPAVKCSLCLFVTEIGERNVRPRLSIEQVAPPYPPELIHQC